MNKTIPPILLIVLGVMLIGFQYVDATYISVPPSGLYGNTSDVAWGVSSLSGASGDYYFGGFYAHDGTVNDFSPVPVTFGITNSSAGGHIFFVLGENAVDEVTLEVTGIRVDDATGATPSYTSTVTIPSNAVINDYFETDEKFLGQVEIELISGTPLDTEFGCTKYWDNNNGDFTVEGFDFTFLGGANDDLMNMYIVHHTTSGWTFTGTGEALHPTSVAVMRDDQINSGGARNGVEGAWKRTGLDEKILGSESEGLILHLVTTSNNAVQIGTMVVTVSEP